VITGVWKYRGKSIKAEMILVMQDLVEHVLPKEINPIITSLKYGL
jgi:hypothetical protein